MTGKSSNSGFESLKNFNYQFKKSLKFIRNTILTAGKAIHSHSNSFSLDPKLSLCCWIPPASSRIAFLGIKLRLNYFDDKFWRFVFTIPIKNPLIDFSGRSEVFEFFLQIPDCNGFAEIWYKVFHVFLKIDFHWHMKISPVSLWFSLDFCNSKYFVRFIIRLREQNKIKVVIIFQNIIIEPSVMFLLGRLNTITSSKFVISETILQP